MDYNIHNLSRRERQIMDVLFKKGRASAKEVLESIPDAPGYSAVRALVNKLVEKGHARFEQDGAKYIYMPNYDMDSARDGALNRLVNTFFSGSVADAVNGLLGSQSSKLSNEDLDKLEQMIETARNNSHKKSD